MKVTTLFSTLKGMGHTLNALKRPICFFPVSPNEHPHSPRIAAYLAIPALALSAPAPRVSRQRLPARNVFYHRSAEHRGHCILSFAFAFDREEDVYQFSVCFPYSYSRLQLHLSEVEKLRLPWVRRQLLANTVVGAQLTDLYKCRKESGEDCEN